MFEYIRDIGQFNAESFHFLRPAFLWAFIPVGLVAILVLLVHREDNKWKRVIAPALRPFMFTRERRAGFLFPLLAYLLITGIGILALSGPAWTREEVPGTRNEAVLVIALDVSPSMLAEDIQPNRLERAKFKIRDLLDANPGSRVSLHAWSGTAHTVVPLCSDYRIIRHHLDALSPAIMPRQGSNLEMMLDLADSVLSPLKAPSTLLLVSDELTSEAVPLLTAFADRHHHRVEVLCLATVQGAPVPKNRAKQPLTDRNGNVVVSRLDTGVLFELETHERIHVNTLTLDNSDMELIAKSIRRNLVYQEDEEKSEQQWRDMGYILVLLLVLLVPFWFRRGWMIRYAIIPLATGLASCSGISGWEDLWYTRDYQGQRLYEAGSFEEAGYTYESAFHQGVAFYRSGNFDAAAQAFAADSSTESLYNLGLSYSRLGDYDRALEVLQMASDQDPDNPLFRDAVEETTRTIGIIDSLRQEGKVLELPGESGEKGKLEERRASSKDEELSSDTEVDELPDDGKRVTDEVETDMRKAEELEEVPDNFQSGSGPTPRNIMLKSIPADPSEFLRRRFNFQYEKYHMEQVKSTDPW